MSVLWVGTVRIVIFPISGKNKYFFRMEAKLKILNECMTDHPDFPKPGILFKNIMPLFSDPKRLEILGEVLEETIREKFPGCTKLVGLESRGFLIGRSK